MDAVTQLEREWPLLARGALRPAFAAWRRDEAALARFGGPQALLVFLQRAPSAETDAPLHALLALSRGDRLAARLCLQALLPALKAQARRLLQAGRARDEVWELELAHAWQAIRGFPLTRRRRVAANVVLQVLHDTTRALRERGGQPESLEDGERAVAGAASPLGVDGLLAAARAVGLLGAGDAELIARSRVDGEALAALAAGRGVAYETLRKRRQRAEARLRAELGCPDRGRLGPYLG